MTTQSAATVQVTETELLSLDTATTIPPRDAAWFLACLEYAGPRGSMRHQDEARMSALLTEMASYAAE